MDFESILEQWEKGEKYKSRGKPAASRASLQPESPADLPEDWLDSYLPDAQVLAVKENEVKQPVSGGTSIWRKREVQDVLDLHGLTGKEAISAMDKFILSMRRRGLRKGLIIHGKGLHSPEGSILAPIVRSYLEKSVEAGEFGRAARKDGGSGATWFLLRQRSR